MYRSKIVFGVGVVFMVVGFIPLAYAAECKTSSGSTCKLTCSVGTLALVCSDQSTTCEGSCSDSSGKMERNIVRSLQSLSRGNISNRRGHVIFRRLKRGKNRIGPYTIIINPHSAGIKKFLR